MFFRPYPQKTQIILQRNPKKSIPTLFTSPDKKKKKNKKKSFPPYLRIQIPNNTPGLCRQLRYQSRVLNRFIVIECSSDGDAFHVDDNDAFDAFVA